METSYGKMERGYKEMSYHIKYDITNVIEHIVESEMGGVIDKEDSYYPTLLALCDLLEKALDEQEIMRGN